MKTKNLNSTRQLKGLQPVHLPESAAPKAWLETLNLIDKHLAVAGEHAKREIEKQKKDSMLYGSLCDASLACSNARQICRRIKKEISGIKGSGRKTIGRSDLQELAKLKKEYNNVFGAHLRTAIFQGKTGQFEHGLLGMLPQTI